MRLVVLGCLLLALETVSWCLKDPICGQPPEVNGNDFIKCAGSFEKFIYYPHINTCRKFEYGGCLGNDNSFNTLEKCHKKCQVNFYTLLSC
ncbi:hemolymph trypsin inhibitor B [Drosophila sechellia]|uniref:hemolymph trypsin inhibitor B n=1 Tax=Drosophila sechellia TaxID=7238 RepID=UPI0013DE2366|nr:hemolymph trypsin inhibitor B [Drosophila sechellia]